MALVPYNSKRQRTNGNYAIVPVASNSGKMRATTPMSGRRSNYNSNTGRGTKRYFSSVYRNLSYGFQHTNPVYPKPEVKFFDLNAAGTLYTGSNPVSIGITGTLFCLNPLAQGTSAFTRIGTSVSIKSVAYRYELDLPTAPANQLPTSGRIILVWDKQANGAVPSYTDVFTSANYLAFMNIGATQRFTVLRNQQFSLSPQGDQCLFFEGYCKINMKSSWPVGLSAAGVPISGSLLLIYIADQNAVANQPLLNGCWRIRYQDC